MQFATLLNESVNYLKGKGYIQEAPEDEDEAAPAEEGGDDDLSWLDDSGGDEGSEGEAPTEGGEAPPADAGAGAPPAGGDPMGGGGMGGGGSPGGDAPSEPVPEGNNTGDQPQDQSSPIDAVLGKPPTEVLNTQARVEKLERMVDELENNMENTEVDKALAVDTITEEIAKLLQQPEDRVREVAQLMSSKFTNLFKKIKRLRRLKVDKTNANKLSFQESVDIIRNYIKEG